MSRLLFIITETFSVWANQLTVVTDKIAVDGYRDGEILDLHRPDGSVIIAASSLIRTTPDHREATSNTDLERRLSFILEGMTKDDIPVGTQAWQR